MAFSKAKILRFNDITTCAPPPGAYNPKFEHHVTGAIAYTKDNKPLHPESPATSISDTKSVHSCASARDFRTPPVPRRKRISLPSSSNKNNTNLKSKLFSPVKSEALREKIVECANKDETIKDLESQIEELKFAISALKVDKSELAKEKDDLIQKLKDVEEKLETLTLLLESSKTEKETISEDFEKLKAELKDQNSKQMKQLQEYKTKLYKLVLELEDVRKNISIEIELRESELKKSSEEQHRYEVTLNKTYETVDALKNHLLNSDRDVEQLNKEIEQLEYSKVQIESKYSEVNEKLQETIEERDALKSDNEALMQIHEKVVTLKEDLLKKIDDLKTTADQEIQRLNTELINAKTELHCYVRDQQKVNTNAEHLIANFQSQYEVLENEATNHVERIASLENVLENKDQTIFTQEEIITEQNSQIQDLKDKLKEREHELNEIASVYKKFIDRSKEFDDLQQKHEELLQKCNALEKTVAEQNSLIGPFREQLENYERECQLLLVHKFEAEKEAKEIGLKYAQILGHQNSKQKIKHIVDLKKKNNELVEKKNECETKLLQQKRTIDKLKQKVAQLTKLPKSLPPQEVDKENIKSPARMHNNSTLKERN